MPPLVPLAPACATELDGVGGAVAGDGDDVEKAIGAARSVAVVVEVGADFKAGLYDHDDTAVRCGVVW